jgi:hypothetical protein
MLLLLFWLELANPVLLRKALGCDLPMLFSVSLDVASQMALFRLYAKGRSNETKHKQWKAR